MRGKGFRKNVSGRTKRSLSDLKSVQDSLEGMKYFGWKVELFDEVLTEVSACAEYGMCSSPAGYSVYKVDYKTNTISSGLNDVYIGDGSPVTYIQHGRFKLVPKFEAVYDFCYTNTDDSALQEVFDTLRYEGELDSFWEFAKAKSMSDEVKNYLEYFYLDGEFAPFPDELDFESFSPPKIIKEFDFGLEYYKVFGKKYTGKPLETIKKTVSLVDFDIEQFIKTVV